MVYFAQHNITCVSDRQFWQTAWLHNSSYESSMCRLESGLKFEQSFVCRLNGKKKKNLSETEWKLKLLDKQDTNRTNRSKRLNIFKKNNNNKRGKKKKERENQLYQKSESQFGISCDGGAVHCLQELGADLEFLHRHTVFNSLYHQGASEENVVIFQGVSFKASPSISAPKSSTIPLALALYLRTSDWILGLTWTVLGWPSSSGSQCLLDRRHPWGEKTRARKKRGENWEHEKVSRREIRSCTSSFSLIYDTYARSSLV